MISSQKQTFSDGFFFFAYSKTTNSEEKFFSISKHSHHFIPTSPPPPHTFVLCTGSLLRSNYFVQHYRSRTGVCVCVWSANVLMKTMMWGRLMCLAAESEKKQDKTLPFLLWMSLLYFSSISINVGRRMKKQHSYYLNNRSDSQLCHEKRYIMLTLFHRSAPGFFRLAQKQLKVSGQQQTTEINKTDI